MFTSAGNIKTATGIDVSEDVIRLAQYMIETWVGKTEVEVGGGSDLAILERAVTFQAIYIADSEDTILEQAAVKQMVLGEAKTTFDTDMFAPYMSPWAIKACRRLSWMGPRTIKTGPLVDRQPELGWEYR